MNRRGLAAFQRPLRNDLTLCLALNPCQYARWNWSTQLIVQLIINVESVRRHRLILSNGPSRRSPQAD
ncbi:hypothetical protein I550_2505 [Mycobacterium intracellulare 1956]|uniref:Uncharacterized protein n=1 Tax=Mycobacterium intracellulare 1956 TaxID=1299331 RepID=X8CSI8_MYCIT|nr:hypothetical protein I548_5461 [Mycobacterium intracellulare]EUA59357.1 hypothetical protein I550_2505 [Mycobacterium intracellulare 1956]